jgi:hypothetical protein
MSDKTPTLPTINEPSKLPTLAELFDDSIEVAGKSEGLNAILNTPPPSKWLKEHPYIKVKDQDGNQVPYRYLPVDKVEYLLRKIFKTYHVEITGQGTAFNGVWVTVRIHYFNPALNAMDWTDGIGSVQLQTAKGTSPADLANINNGAIAMAFPAAKSYALKDAAEMIGNIFGANVSRKDTIAFTPDAEIIDRAEKRKQLLNNKKNV